MNKKKIVIILVIILAVAIAFSIIAFTGIKYKIMVPKEIVSFEEKEHITITYTYPLQNEKFDIDVTDEEIIKMIKDNINNKKLENYSGIIGLAVMGTYKVELDENTSFAFDYDDDDGYVMMKHNEKQFLTKIEPKILSKIVAIVDEKLTENIQMFKTEKITITNKEGKQIEINRKTAIDYLLEQCKDITSEEIIEELNIVAPDYRIKFNDEVEIFKYNQSGQGFLLKNGNLNRAYGLEGFNTFLENVFENLEEKEKMFTADKITITSKEKTVEITDETVIEKITTPLIYSDIQERDWLENHDITEEYENGIKIKINTCEFLIPGKIGYVTIGNRYIITEDKKIKLCFPLQDIEKYVNELLGNKQEKTNLNISEDKKQSGEGSTQDIEIINYEGTFKAKGVVVRTEGNTLTLMPIIANEEYRNEENFYIENSQVQNLKQDQEVIVTFHYRKSSNENFTYEPIVEKVEILKEKSDTQIPRDVLVKAYSTKENVIVTIDKEKSNNKQIVFTITDKNELKYNYFTMKYNLYKYNTPQEKQEVIYTENGASTAGYNPWPEVTKIAEISNEANYTLDSNGKINFTIDYSQVYGELKEGKYRFSLSTVNNLRQSITNPKAQEYPYDGVNIEINFNIDANGKAEYGEIVIR